MLSKATCSQISPFSWSICRDNGMFFSESKPWKLTNNAYFLLIVVLSTNTGDTLTCFPLEIDSPVKQNNKFLHRDNNLFFNKSKLWKLTNNAYFLLIVVLNTSTGILPGIFL